MIIYEFKKSAVTLHYMKIQTILKEICQNIIQKLRSSNTFILNESKTTGLSLI